MNREELIERWNKSCIPYQKIIDNVTFEECICVISGIPINCNHEEMIIRAIYQKVLKLQKIEALYEPKEFGKGISREERDREVQKILEE